MGIKTRLQSDHDRHQQRLAEIEAEQKALADEQSQRLVEWCTQWQPANIEPQSPREMRAWWRTQQDLVGIAASLRQQQASIGQLQQTRDAAHARLAKLIAPSDQETADVSLRELLRLCQQQLTQWQEAAQLSEKLQGQLDTLQHEEQDASDDFSTAETAIANWQTQ